MTKPNAPRPEPARRGPPPEATGIESEHHEALRRAATRVAIRLRDGSTVSGTLAAHDRETLEIALDAGGHRLLRKTEVRTVEEADGGPQI